MGSVGGDVITVQGKSTLIRGTANQKLVQDYQHLFEPKVKAAKGPPSAEKVEAPKPKTFSEMVATSDGFGRNENSQFIKYF